MAQIIPSKLIPERITVKINFLDVLEWGEEITLALSDIEVVSGTDPFPELILRLQPVVNADGVEVSQQLRLGLAGTLYKLTVEAQTNLGNTYSKSVNLTIIPSEAVTPLPFGTYYTSELYPIEVLEGFDSTFIPAGGNILTSTVESFISGIVILSGNISDGFVNYSIEPEGIDVSDFVVVSGSISTGFISYTMQPEGINSVSLTPQTGSITVILITYSNYPPEGINATGFAPTTGTIV